MTVSVIDTASSRIVRRLWSATVHMAWWFSTDGRRVYVTKRVSTPSPRSTSPRKPSSGRSEWATNRQASPTPPERQPP
jgi:hypothetical protein